MGIRALSGSSGVLETYLREHPDILSGNNEYLIEKVNNIIDEKISNSDKVILGKDLSVRVSNEGKLCGQTVEVVHNETGKVLITMEPESLKGLGEVWRMQGLFLDSKV